jgi:hypothetical protein
MKKRGSQGASLPAWRAGRRAAPGMGAGLPSHQWHWCSAALGELQLETFTRKDGNPMVVASRTAGSSCATRNQIAPQQSIGWPLSCLEQFHYICLHVFIFTVGTHTPERATARSARGADAAASSLHHQVPGAYQAPPSVELPPPSSRCASFASGCRWLSRRARQDRSAPSAAAAGVAP